MIRAVLLTVVALCIGNLAAGEIWAATQSMTRAEIRSMPVQERPSRPGHFYGNTVRRRTSRWQAMPPTQPIASAPQ